jgi:hypothetical protein
MNISSVLKALRHSSNSTYNISVQTAQRTPHSTALPLLCLAAIDRIAQRTSLLTVIVLFVIATAIIYTGPLVTEPLLSNGCCIAPCFAVAAQQRVYTSKY